MTSVNSLNLVKSKTCMVKENVPLFMESEIVNYLVRTVHNDFIVIGALNTEIFVFQDGPFGRVISRKVSD